MRAILMFKLPQDQAEHMLATSANDMALALSDVLQKIRSRLKYGENVSGIEADTLEDIRESVLTTCQRLVSEGLI